jgi:hypothetical protein
MLVELLKLSKVTTVIHKGSLTEGSGCNLFLRNVVAARAILVSVRLSDSIIHL